jgi:hypothetical protein
VLCGYVFFQTDRALAEEILNQPKSRSTKIEKNRGFSRIQKAEMHEDKTNLNDLIVLVAAIFMHQVWRRTAAAS